MMDFAREFLDPDLIKGIIMSLHSSILNIKESYNLILISFAIHFGIFCNFILISFAIIYIVLSFTRIASIKY